MPFARTPKNGWIWYDNNCHSTTVGCLAEGKEKCTCEYHISNGLEQYGFNSYQEAEEKWMEVTGSEKFILGKTPYPNS